MSRYSDINQLLEQMGTSDRSAGDPWTISRSPHGTVKSDSFSPSVVADLGAPAQDLTAAIQTSEQIAKADRVATSPTGASSSGSSKSTTGSGILGDVLSVFPLASTIGKLFGFGGSTKPTPLTPYIAPPSISFEGASPSSLSASTSSSLLGSQLTPSTVSQQGGSSAFAPGVSSLSYGATGLPRTVEESPNVSSSRADTPSSTPAPATSAGQPSVSDNHAPDLIGQLSSLTSANFSSQPAATSPLPSADLAATTSVHNPGSSSPSPSTNGNGATPAGANTNTSSPQQGQSILVQVQAMDSQSFMDHSNDIAQAVRQAMLNSHSVNDVIADL